MEDRPSAMVVVRAAREDPRENPAEEELPELGAEVDWEVCFLLTEEAADDAGDDAPTPDKVRCMAMFIMGPLRSPALLTPLAAPAFPAFPFAISRFSGLPTASILSDVGATTVVARELAV